MGSRRTFACHRKKRKRHEQAAGRLAGCSSSDGARPRRRRGRIGAGSHPGVVTEDLETRPPAEGDSPSFVPGGWKHQRRELEV